MTNPFVSIALYGSLPSPPPNSPQLPSWAFAAQSVDILMIVSFVPFLPFLKIKDVCHHFCITGNLWKSSCQMIQQSLISLEQGRRWYFPIFKDLVFFYVIVVDIVNMWNYLILYLIQNLKFIFVEPYRSFLEPYL